MISAKYNDKPFREVCSGTYGRKVIITNVDAITRENVVKELSKALVIHWQNRVEIEYLDNYYRGVQPIEFRVKNVRPEINNKVVVNHAYEIVEFKTAQNFGEPVQYVRRGQDESKSDEIKLLNDYMYSENKGECDIEIGRWRSICGTAYRYIYVDNSDDYLDEAPFGIECADPKDNFIVYSSNDGKKPMFSVSCRKNADNEQYYVVYTNNQRFEIKNSKVVEETINGMRAIPIIEYPNNARRLSDIEIVISILDGMNKITSDRINGIEQFVQAIFKFLNCEITDDQFEAMCRKGMLKLRTVSGADKADVEIMKAELNQEQTQVAKDDLYKDVLIVEGMPSREQNTGGDTGQAVYLRNGWDFGEQRAELQEPIFEKSERDFLKIIFRILKINELATLKLSDVEIKTVRSKSDNMSVKATVLQILLACGIDYQTAIKTCNLWSDPEEVYIKSVELMKAKFESDKQNNTTQAQEVIDVVE